MTITDPIFLVGLNHRSAPLTLREQLALPDDDLRRLLHQLAGESLLEVVVVSTCNRLEVYGFGPDAAGRTLVEQILADFHGIGPDQIAQHSYFETGHAAVRQCR
jgi:glutamyl-tRNA reductase